jgi:hypothetical protein
MRGKGSTAGLFDARARVFTLHANASHSLVFPPFLLPLPPVPFCTAPQLFQGAPMWTQTFLYSE